MSAEAQLRRYIVENDLEPGARLPSEAELVQALGSSRTVVREALRALEALGLLEARAGSGWYIRAFDVTSAARVFARGLAFHPRALLDLLTVRRAIEADLVAELAGQLEEPDLAILEDLADEMRWRASRGQSFAEQDGEFHRYLAALSGNLVAYALVDLHWVVTFALFQQNLAPVSPSRAPSVAEAHARIVAALRAGDSQTASQTIREHHEESWHRVADWLASQPATPEGSPARAIQAALQAALLWPGPDERGATPAKFPTRTRLPSETDKAEGA